MQYALTPVRAMNGILVPPAPGAASATLRLTARPFPHCALARGGHCSAPEHRRLSAASPHLQAALMVAATRECGGESDGESGGEKVLMLAAGCWGGWWLRAAHTQQANIAVRAPVSSPVCR